jgi:hypothetical protein
MSSSHSHNRLRNLTLLAASLLVSVALAELGVRLILPQQLAVWHTMPDGLVIHPPGLKVYLHEFGQEVAFNALGMRDRPRQPQKREGTLRVLVLGDSFMEALQVPFEDSFPSLLQAGLRAKLKREVEVVNAAVSGWAQDDQLYYLRKHGLRLEPDLILIAMTVHNDVLENLRERFHTLADGELRERPETRMSDLEYRSLLVKGFFASRSHLWQLLRKLKHLAAMQMLAADLNRHVAGLITPGAGATASDRGWELTFALFRGIRDAGKRIGARTAILLIPLRIQLHPAALEGFRNAAGLAAEDIDLDKPQQLMRKFGAEAGIDIIDPLPAMRGWTATSASGSAGASLHLQEGHWNNDGHRLASEIVARSLIEKGMLRQGPPCGRAQ